MNAANLTKELGDSFGAKDEALIEGFTEYLQKYLHKRGDDWARLSKLTMNDFFHSHPQKCWNDKDQEKIDGQDIEKWDAPLCITWILQFRWDPILPALTKEEQGALADLRSIRHKTKHRASSKEASESNFKANCDTVEAALNFLGANAKTISEILKSARNRVSADEEELLKIIDRSKWNYETDRILGSGSFGIVIAVKDKVDNQSYAIKIIPNRVDGSSASDNENLLRESRNLAQLHHPNVVQYKSSEIFTLSTDKIKEIILWGSASAQIKSTSQDFLRACFDKARSFGDQINGLFIKTEICCETLREWLNTQITDKLAISAKVHLRIGQNIIDGLSYIHSKKIIHRDLRPENIYFAEANFCPPMKIGDFGLSNQTKIYELQTMTKAVGNPYYRAPEVDKEHKEGKAKYSQEADLFSLGLILAEIFDAVQESELIDKLGQICYGKDTGERIKNEAPWLDKLILQLTNKYPERRIDKDASRNPILINLHSLLNEHVDDSMSISTQNIKVGRENVPSSHQPLVLQNSRLEMQPVDLKKSVTSQSSRSNQPLLDPARLLVRKSLQHNKAFWTTENLAKFFTLLEEVPVAESEFQMRNNEATPFNRRFSGLQKRQPNKVTQINVCRILSEIGFQTLADEINNKLDSTANGV